MLKVGITGGIGSGKSTVCRIFELIGVPVYYADDRAKWLMANDEKVKTALIDEFGRALYDQQGELQRSWLASRVFGNPKSLAALNSIVHPAVGADSAEWMDQHLDQAYVIKEAALLIESGSYKSLDRLVVVIAPEEVRIRRVMDRDGVTEDQVRSRMAHQVSDAARMTLADHLIYNDASHLLIPQVLELHQTLLTIEEAPDLQK